LSRWITILIALALLISLPGAGINTYPYKASSSVGSYIIMATSAEQAARLVNHYGGVVTSYLEIINGVAAYLPLSSVANLRAEAAVSGVAPNAIVSSVGLSTKEKKNGIPDTDYPEVIGADAIWKQGNTGNGVGVAVLDTGFAAHPGLLLKDSTPKPRQIGWIDLVEGRKMPTDPNGHGTHIAGIIANSQKGSDESYNGVAPGVNLVGIRVLDKHGVGTYENVVKGIEWAVRHKKEYNIRVMNLSIVSPVQSPYWADPFNIAVMKAWSEGIVVVAAAGNSGPSPMSIGVPGNNPYVITVGAFTDNFTPKDWSDDYITPFSSAGPTLDGFVKPDVVAPGAHIVSVMMPNSEIARDHDANWEGGAYFSMAGTSQAAAVVSGLTALIIAKNPSLSPDQVKQRVVATAFPWVNKEKTDTLYSMWQQGAGRVNGVDAVFANVDGSANQGMNVKADISGQQHFEGFSYYDQEAAAFRLRDPFGASSGSYGTWAGAYGTWAGSYGTWAGSYGTWAGSYGTWAGAYGTWAGSYGTWAGAYGTWAGSYGTWAGAYGTWAGGYPNWPEGFASWAGNYGSSEFASRFTNWSSTGSYGTWAGSRDFVGNWIEEK
jgi:serine protease AprX